MMPGRNGEHVIVGIVSLGCADVAAVACDHHFGDEEVETVEGCGVRLRAIVDGWVESVGDIGDNGGVRGGEVDLHVGFEG